MQVIILAGGSGIRLWPLSKKGLPKQFLRIDGKRSLLQNTVLRFRKSPITIVTHELFKKLVQKDLEEISAHDVEIITEKESKNTLAAIALAYLHLKEKKLPTKTKFCIVPSDHYFAADENLSMVIEEIDKQMPENKICLFGNKPNLPHTGYGYIELGEKKGSFFHVIRFHEKPDVEKAKYFLLSQKYLWNVGMAVMSLDTFYHEIKKHVSGLLPLMEQGFDVFQSNYHTLPSISFDYALLEKSTNSLVYPLSFGWSDVGSWDNLYDVLDKDEAKNVTRGNVVTMDTQNSLILGGKKLISTIGLSDMIIVETDKALFIARRGEGQKVKELVEKMKDLSKEETTKTNKKPSQVYIK
jgi:mannose-1-phosphate guanylyltransferase / mannose-6-phosphate isomerase